VIVVGEGEGEVAAGGRLEAREEAREGMGEGEGSGEGKARGGGEEDLEEGGFELVAEGVSGAAQGSRSIQPPPMTSSSW